MNRALLFFLLLNFQVALTQIQFVPGFIVLNSGDTVKGEIMDYQWVESPDKFEFRIDGAVQVKKTDDIQAFTIVNRKSFKRFTFKFDGDMLGERFSYPNQFSPGFPRSRLPVKWIERTRFLEIVISGSFSLFKFTDEEKRIHFFLQTPDNDIIEELQYHEYVSSGTTLNTSQYFKFQLQSISKDCELLQDKILKLRYEESELSDMIERINNCRGGVVTSKAIVNNTKRKSYFGPVLDIFSVRIKDLNKSFDLPHVGLGFNFELFSRHRPDRESLYTELLYKSVSENIDYIDPINKVSFQSIKLNSEFRLYDRRGRIYSGIGFSSGLRFNTQFNNGMKTSQFELGPLGSIGYRFWKLKSFIELRYEYLVPFGLPTIGNNESIGLLISKQF